MAERLLAAEEKHTEQEIQFLFPFGMTATEALWNEFDSSCQLLCAQSLMILIVFLELKWVIICRPREEAPKWNFSQFRMQHKLKGLSFLVRFSLTLINCSVDAFFDTTLSAQHQNICALYILWGNGQRHSYFNSLFLKCKRQRIFCNKVLKWKRFCHW